MVIYGVALLAGCMMIGLVIGDLLGQLLGINANLGGVGIAMLLLIFVTGYLKSRGKLPDATVSGINFWNAMYIPIVVAMAASQNVAAAFSGGLVALFGGALAVVLGLAMVPIFAGRRSSSSVAMEADESLPESLTTHTVGR
ncbi:malonate transporter subunit MadL [Chromohalobacter canadensis]|uniref:malonate transporter subunit MadL n=1 Tax=Chromohalobacter canadensis TaxID=141389 RepID=UPI0021C180F8|nr:malonate transporter subunit MadL [Chromohalobacter canadensis]MCT8469329.1 malonate transporter subunit MadL [Chromohalobacter canadensis]MCT8471953.1 malonate transporter subunit MadL [Chromohalobacter canadensis]MCT8499934.1 malonate transporter subunit MadL [Chromohalobacter canadensis]